MKEWFNSLQPRERQLLIASAAVLSLLILFYGVWRPFVGGLEQLRSGIDTAKKNVQEMKLAQQEIRQLKTSRGQSSTKTTPKGQSLTGVIDKARGKDIPAPRRMEPDANRVRMWIDQVPFDAMILWIGRLRRQFGIEVTEITVDSKEHNGIVNVTLTFHGGGA